eukprot:2685721-Pleurochrysis_carterae.AAC.5
MTLQPMLVTSRSCNRVVCGCRTSPKPCPTTGNAPVSLQGLAKPHYHARRLLPFCALGMVGGRIAELARRWPTSCVLCEKSAHARAQLWLVCM